MRLIDADELLRKWDQLTSRGRIEFDQVIMSEPTQDDFKGEKKSTSGKSLFVMDTPKNGCADCTVCRESFFKTICGITGNGVSGNNERGGFPEECPLKPMPEKMNCPPMNGENYEAGWNACIDAITGGME